MISSHIEVLGILYIVMSVLALVALCIAPWQFVAFVFGLPMSILTPIIFLAEYKRYYEVIEANSIAGWYSEYFIRNRR